MGDTENTDSHKIWGEVPVPLKPDHLSGIKKTHQFRVYTNGKKNTETKLVYRNQDTGI